MALADKSAADARIRHTPDHILPSPLPSLLVTAFALLGAAVLVGSVLGVLHLRRERPAIPAWLSGLHGLLAAAGLVALVLSVRGPPRGAAAGAGSFGVLAAVLATVALIAGAATVVARLRKKPFTGFLVGVHATLAVSAFVVLAAYVFA